MRTLSSVFCIVALVPSLLAQSTDVVLLKSWPAPLYWQPSPVETEAAAFRTERASPRAAAPVNSLVFVGMTPCRVVDTRSSQPFTGAFGPPSLVGGASRTFPIQSSSTCTIPAIAQAYSFNVTVVPPGSLGFLTIYPTGQSRPLASTLNSLQGFIVANAAVVAAGTSGSVDVFVSNNTDVVIDINGYYAAESGITLAQGNAGAPSLSFAGDAGTGIFSSAVQTLDFATSGTSRLTVRSDGDVDIPGSMRKSGTLFLHNLGTQNTAVGLDALAADTSGCCNTAIGFEALLHNSTGAVNTAIGTDALSTNNTGSENTAIGVSALSANSTGFENTANGVQTLFSNTIGHNNTADGYKALNNNTANNNTASGSNALQNNTTGANNTALGFNAGVNLTIGSNNIMIGNAGVAGEGSTIRIGDVQTKTFIAGINGVTIAGGVDVLIDSSGHLGTVLSSRRFKEDIQDMGEASSRLLRLRPVTYRYKRAYDDGSKPLDYGLIAEEVAEVYPDLVVKSKDGQVETVQYHKLTPMLLNEVQKQNHHTQQQDETIRQLQEQNRQLTTRLAALEALLSSRVPATSAAGQ